MSTCPPRLPLRPKAFRRPCRSRRAARSPTATAPPSAGYAAASALDPYAVPSSGLVPTVPGVLAGSPPTVPAAPRGSAPGWPSWAPSVVDLGWTDAPAAAPAATRPTTTFSPPPTAAPRSRCRDFPTTTRCSTSTRCGATSRSCARRVNGKPAGLVRQRGDHAEAAGRDRPAVVLLRPRELEHPSRRPRAGGARHRRLRGCPRDGAAIHRRVQERGDRLRPRHHRGHQPGGLRWGGKHLGQGDEIVITHLEHHANIVPWQLLVAADRCGTQGGPGRRRGQICCCRSTSDLLGPEDQTRRRRPRFPTRSAP